MKFFLRRAIEASDERPPRNCATRKPRASALALYRPFYNRLSRAGFDMLDLKQAKALLKALAA